MFGGVGAIPGAEKNAPAGGSGTKVDPVQLKSKFKHAGDFGVKGNYNLENAGKFQKALEEPLGDPRTTVVQRTYRGNTANIHVNSTTGNAVITDTAGNFMSGWRLSPQQMHYVRTTGSPN